jgi:hypothetical protein
MYELINGLAGVRAAHTVTSSARWAMAIEIYGEGHTMTTITDNTTFEIDIACSLSAAEVAERGQEFERLFADDAEGPNLDQDLAVLRDGRGDVLQDELLGTAVLSNDHCFHCAVLH